MIDLNDRHEIKAAIFDMDGTLLDSMRIWDSLAEDYLRRMGIEPQENLTKRFKTLSVEQSADYYIQNYLPKKSRNEIVNEINSLIEEFYIYKAPLKKDAKELLQFLHTKGVKMCVATTIDKSITKKALKRCGIYGFFTDIFTCKEVGAGKDEPLIYNKAREALGVSAKHTFVFEDALHALKTAKKAGFSVVGVYDSYEAEQSELKELSDFYIRDFTSAISLFEAIFNQQID